MSNEWEITGESGEETEPQFGNANKALKDAYRAQKDQNQKLMERLEALEAVNRRNTAADLIEAAGAKRSLAKHYTGDADPDKVNTWLNDFRDALGVAPSQTETTGTSLATETQAQYEKMNQQGSGAATVGNLEAIAGDLSGANSTADLIAALSKLK
jgi:hypothetical protein